MGMGISDSGTKDQYFVIPSEYSKNKCDRLVILNHVASQIIAEVREQHPIYVFTRRDGQHRLRQMNNKSWVKARKQNENTGENS